MKNIDATIAEIIGNATLRGTVEDALNLYDVVSQLTEIRKERGIKQWEVAEVMGTHQTQVSMIENGKSEPKPSVLQSYARAVGARLVLTIE